ncbi:MAG: ArsR family transcriptional regulator [Candidatus Bathyarchaeia archaeon]
MSFVKVEILEMIVRSLAERPKSIKELSEELGVGWKTCQRYLKSLQRIGVLVEIKTRGESLFMSRQPYRPKLLTVPKIRVGESFKIVDVTPPNDDEVEVLM